MQPFDLEGVLEVFERLEMFAHEASVDSDEMRKSGFLLRVKCIRAEIEAACAFAQSGHDWVVQDVEKCVDLPVEPLLLIYKWWIIKYSASSFLVLGDVIACVAPEQV